ncbi:MAG TPA: ATP-binding protein [bacterium]|nr:ATP-binding protein [bacterium]
MSRNRDEKVRQIYQALRSSIFKNRFTLHPRRLQSLAEEEFDHFLAYLKSPDLDQVEEMGKVRADEGMGEYVLFQLGNVFRQIVFDQAADEEFHLIRFLSQMIDEYIAAYITGYMGRWHDQTLDDQEQLRKALSKALDRQKRELYVKNHAINTSINGIMLTDLEGAITYVNPAFLDMWGYQASAEVLGRDGGLFWNNRKASGMRSVLQKHGGWQKEFTSHKHDQKHIDVMVSSSLIRDVDEEPVGIMTSFVEITDRKRLEEQLQKSQKLEAMGNLAGGIAHDFNNLLTVIIGFIDMLSVNVPSDSPKLLKFIDGAKKSAEKAATLTQQLLAFSRRQILKPKIIDIGELIIDIEKILKRLIREDIHLVTDIESDVGVVKADPGQIEQVLINLAVNARDAMPMGGELRIQARNVSLDNGRQRYSEIKTGDYVYLSVCDNGDGIYEEIQERIFEPFFTTKKMGKGTGLGLSTVYGIVKQSGGYIFVESELGEGTTFNLYFPRIDEPEVKRDNTGATIDLPHGDETILIVEDEEAVRHIASESLQSMGYTTIEAGSGEEALAACNRVGCDSIDLIITDVVMPNMSGYELANEILLNNPRTKILYMSGYVDDEIVKRAILDEGKPFLQKPFSPHYLAQKVAEVLRIQYTPSS